MAGKAIRRMLRQRKRRQRTIQMLNLYADFCEEVLAIPVIKGRNRERKSLRQRKHIQLNQLMHDGKAPQSGTSHNFGDGFAKALNTYG